jgi:hypothetical protein
MSNVKSLRLEDNKWGTDRSVHVHVIADALKLYNLKIKTILLRKNPFIAAGLFILMFACVGSNLTYLNISDNACVANYRIIDSSELLKPDRLVC